MGTRARLSRRGLLAWPLVLVTAGCGFQPIYGRSGLGEPAAEAGLAAVAVALIPNRQGQLLRQALQARLERESGRLKKFDLVVALSISAEGLSIQQDTTATRLRVIGEASWTLKARDALSATVTTGFARSVDGLNTFDQQYFAQDLEFETVQGRIADALADRITTQLAIWFVRHPV